MLSASDITFVNVCIHCNCKYILI